MKKLIMWSLIVALSLTPFINVFCEDYKAEYQFDEIAVIYAVQFKAIPCNLQSDNWLTQLAGGNDKPLDVIYGEVNYKLNGIIYGSEKYIKITGESGSSQKLLANSGSFERAPDTNEIIKEISQLWSYKVIDGNSVVKDSSGALSSVIMQEEFYTNHEIKSLTLKNGVLLAPINTDEPMFDVYKADLDSVIYFDSNKNNIVNKSVVNYNMNLASVNLLTSGTTIDLFEKAISDSLSLYGVKLLASSITWDISNLVKTNNIISVRVTNSLNDYNQLPKLIVAVYGDNKKFLGLKSVAVESGKIDYSFDMTGITGIKTIKAFMWEGFDTLKSVASFQETPQ